MQSPPDAPGGGGVDRCAEQRAAVSSLCDDAHQAQAHHAEAKENARGLRRRLVSAEHALTESAESAQAQNRGAEKARAREQYEEERELATNETELAEATAGWARALDRINRSGRLAERDASKAKLVVGQLENQAREAEQAERTTRMAAEAAEAACLDARVRLASCEEQPQADSTTDPQVTVFEPHAATGGHAPAVPSLPAAEPLVIESLLMGDRQAVDLAGNRIAEHTGLQPAEAILQVQVLIDGIISVAIREGFLLFEDGHPFWSHLTNEEARDVIAALARLGFQFEPSEGWHAGRSPTSMDLSMALAYAGLDARSMRDLPSNDELRALPASISVDARSYLAMAAPELTVDSMVGLLERRATQLEPLWNDWGQVRPILLSDRSALGAP